jgi:predicted acylesterase/phospholipase RssA
MDVPDRVAGSLRGAMLLGHAARRAAGILHAESLGLLRAALPARSRTGRILFDSTEKTLNELVDFSLLARCKPRLTVGAANVRTSEMRYFDTGKSELTVKHIIASGAAPGIPRGSHRRPYVEPAGI